MEFYMWDKALLKKHYDMGLAYEDYLPTLQAEQYDKRWVERYDQLTLTDAQRTLVASFAREMPVLCLTGPWCGDCSLQGAAMARIAEVNPLIKLRFINRDDEHGELVVASTVNQGYRVPITWFMAEDFELCSWFGDRTLSRYRSMAQKQLAPDAKGGCNSPRPNDPVREVLQEVLEEFERVQLMLRLSGRLREIHSD
jgi:hypothetical protein